MNQADLAPRSEFHQQMPHLALRISSILIVCASAVLLLATIVIGFQKTGLFSTLLACVLAALCVVLFLHTRFLLLARKEHRLTAAVLDATEHEFQSVFETALDSILILDDAAVCRDANPAAERLLGVGRQELLGQPLVRFHKDATEFGKSWDRLLADGQKQGQSELRRKDGSELFVEFTAKANVLAGRHVAILRDITRRRRAELSLRESEERFQQMADNIQEVFWMLDARTRGALYVNRAYQKITGHSPNSLIDDPSAYEDLIHPDDRLRVLARLKEATQTGKFDEKIRIVLRDGEARWIWVRGFPVRDEDGTILRLVGTAVDVTAQREAEGQVIQNLALAEAAWAEADALRKATLALAQNLRMDDVLDTLLDSLRSLVRYESAQVLLLEADSRLFLARESIQKEDRKQSGKYPLTFDAADFPALQRVIATQRGVLLPDTKLQPEWRDFKGRACLRSWLSVPLLASNRVLGVLCLGHSEPNSFTQEHLRVTKSLAVAAAVAIQNARLYECAEIYGTELERRISDLHEAQRALEQSEEGRRASEERFKSVFRSSPIAFSITALADGKFLDVNEAFERRYGYSREEVLGRTTAELGIWEDPREREKMLAEIQRGTSIRNAVTRVRLKSAEVVATVYSAETIQLDGEPCLLVVSEDLPPLAETE